AGGPLVAGAAGVSGTSGRFSFRLNGSARFDQVAAVHRDAAQPALRLGGGLALLRVALAENVSLVLELGGSYHQAPGLDHLVLEALPQRTTSGFATLRLDARDLPSILDTVSVWTRGKLLSIGASSLASGLTYDGAHASDAEAGIDLGFDLPKKIT